MNDLESALSQLKDIHEPPGVSWWPLAPGWWILTFLALIAVSLVVFLLHKRKRSIRRLALVELNRIDRDFSINRKDEELLKNLSVFLRRISIAKSGSSGAALTGKEWMLFLDSLSSTRIFIQGPGAVLSDGQYQRTIHYDPQELLAAIKLWLRNMK